MAKEFEHELEYRERLKELKGIRSVGSILSQNKPLDESIQEICSLIPEAFQYPDHTVVRIVFDANIFVSKNFKETKWSIIQTFETPGNHKGVIQVFYLREFPTADEGPFLNEERDLLLNLSQLISGSLSRRELQKMLGEHTERLKELRGINQTSQIISQWKSIDETLYNICAVLPLSWQYPDDTVVRISFGDKLYTSNNFVETPWFMRENFITFDNKKGSIEVFYLKDLSDAYNPVFLKEEGQLINNIGQLISGFLNQYRGRELYQQMTSRSQSVANSQEYRDVLINNKQPIQQFFNQQTIDKYIYLDMMRFKVKEILFVATLYDAFILENEDAFFEQFMGEIYQYSLFSLPRITAVSSHEQALALIDAVNFDLVILMVSNDKQGPVDFSNVIKQKNPCLKVYLLLNNKSMVKHFEENVPVMPSVDKIFVWNGDSQIFFAIVKSIEDFINAENDTRVGLVRVIILIEDSSQYYSRYLSLLYSIIFGQIQRLISSERNELDKISKMRSRPKIVHAVNYEEASFLFNKYKDYLLCVISDVEFDKDGTCNKQAGLSFVEMVRSINKDVPIILQSSENVNNKIAQKLDVEFINKNSKRLSNDLKRIISRAIGLGDFYFKDDNGSVVGIARNIRELETHIAKLPIHVVVSHARKDHYSFWLMSRGEIHLARILNPIKESAFADKEEFRQFLIKTINKSRSDKKRGKVLSFEEIFEFTDKNIVALANGSLGGKGRGLAFIDTLIYNIDFTELVPGITFSTPVTAIIGTDEFELFIDENDLHQIVYSETDYSKIKTAILAGKFSVQLVERLKVFVNQIRKPLAVRSSSIFEDSVTQPFAGIFDTYALPNNNPDEDVRLTELLTAIKLVYASIFSNQARSYFEAINHKLEEEKMAVVIQELVGNKYENYFYPHISGVAQSRNFYPVAHMKPEDGYAVIGVGLGCYIVEGGNAFRFSPHYPNIDIVSAKDILHASQLNFFALDLNRTQTDFVAGGEKAALAYLSIDEAEKHGTLKHCASVFDYNNEILIPGINQPGPKVVNFANILKYEYIPLSNAINEILKTVEMSMGTPVEIEFAVDLEKNKHGLPTFYLLQIKPLIGNQTGFKIDWSELNKDNIILSSESIMGNGLIDDVSDVIYVDIDNFDRLKTIAIAEEIQFMNDQLKKEGKHYLLIGPGRWGTHDHNVGIPVSWPQISNAKVIVELGLDNYALDASLGSHFFHNVTSMKIGYFSIKSNVSNGKVNWDVFKSQSLISATKYVKHVRFKNNLKIVMDGIKRTAAVLTSN